MKRASRSHLQIDWVLFFLRWLLLGTMGGAAFAGIGAAPDNPVLLAAVLAAGAIYNAFIALMLIAGLWPMWFSILTLVGDAVLVVAIFVVSGASPALLLWAALFPVTTASLRLGWLPGLVMVFMVVGASGAAALFLKLGVLNELVALIPTVVVLMTIALLTGLVSERMRLLAIKRTHAERDVDEKRSKNVREQARAIYDLASLVSATLNYERVLDVALDRSTEVMGEGSSLAAQMVAGAFLFRDGQLRVVTARRFTPNDLKAALPGRAGLLAEAISNGEAVYSTQPYRDPELSQIVALRSCRALMVVPLQAGVDIYGVMVFAHPRPDFFGLNHIELLEAICKHTVVAVQNARLYQKLLDEKERIVEVEEEARKKLARDLHDGPTQSVAAIAMRANYIRRLLERDPKTAAEELYKVEDLARRTTKEIRHMLFTLRPLVLESQGLIAALQSLADKMRENYNLNVIIEGEPATAEKLEMHSQGVLFYIVEEAVGNARKHAEAAHIWVRLKPHSPDIIALEIQDDGVGFDVGAVNSSYDHRGSLGMVNMRERTELVSGSLHIDSAPGRGTKITVLVPLTNEAKEKLGTT